MATGTLANTSIKNRYKSLLKLTGTGNDILASGSSAKYVEDGDGNDSALSLSTTRVGIGTTSPAYKLEVEGSANDATRVLCIKIVLLQVGVLVVEVYCNFSSRWRCMCKWRSSWGYYVYWD